MDIRVLVGKQKIVGTLPEKMGVLNCTSVSLAPKYSKTTSKALGAGRWERDGFISRAEVSGEIGIEATVGQLELLLNAGGFVGTKSGVNTVFKECNFDKKMIIVKEFRNENIADLFDGVLTSSIKISAELQSYVNATVSLVGEKHKVREALTESENTKIEAFKGGTLVCLGATIKESGTDMTAKVESFDLTIDNKLEGKGALNTIYTTAIRQSDRGNIILNLKFNKFEAENYKKAIELLSKNTSYVVEFEFKELGTEKKSIGIKLPNVKISNVEATELEGAGGLSKELTAFYDESIKSPIEITFYDYTPTEETTITTGVGV